MIEKEIKDNLESYQIERVEFAYNTFNKVSVLTLHLDDGSIFTVTSPNGLHFDLFDTSRKFKNNDKVILKGLDLAFVVERYIDNNTVQISIEGDSSGSIIYARPDSLLHNNSENAKAEGWI